MSDTVQYLEGEGGATFAFSEPLPEAVASQIAKGELHRVNKDGSRSSTDDSESIDNLTVPELKELAQSLDVPGASAMNKVKLVEAIRARGTDSVRRAGVGASWRAPSTTRVGSRDPDASKGS